MVQPSFGAINLEDISQPNCYKVLDTLRAECDIPVWHDDAQGTACVTLAGLINALKLVDKDIGEVKMVFLGAGASNTTIARIIIAAGGNPENMALFDSRGGLHKGRTDIAGGPALLPQVGTVRTDQSAAHQRLRRSHDGRRRADRRIQTRTGCGQTGVRCADGAQIHRLCLRQSRAGNLSLRRERSRRLYHRHRARRFPEPGQQLPGLPRHPQRRAHGPGQHHLRRA